MKLRGRLLLNGEFAVGEITVDGERFGEVVRTTQPVEGESELPYVAPGLIDLHVHGFGGCDPLDDLAGMAAALARAGTTAFQPTLFPRDPVCLGADAALVESQARRMEEAPALARSLGAHLEGPFLNPLAAGARDSSSRQVTPMTTHPRTESPGTAGSPTRSQQPPTKDRADRVTPGSTTDGLSPGAAGDQPDPSAGSARTVDAVSPPSRLNAGPCIETNVICRSGNRKLSLRAVSARTSKHQ